MSQEDISVIDVDEIRACGSDPALASSDNVKMYDPGGKVRKLKCFSAVDAMVRAGGYVSDIVECIRSNGEWSDLSDSAAKQLLLRYKRAIFGGDKLSVASGSGLKGPEITDNPMEVITKLGIQLNIMHDRIVMESNTERSLQKLFSTTHKEFQTSITFAEKMFRMMSGLGVLRSPGSPDGALMGSTGEYHHKGPVDVDGVLSNPESRQKMMGLFKLLLSNPELMKNAKLLSRHVSDQDKTVTIDVQQDKKKPRRQKKRDRSR